MPLLSSPLDVKLLSSYQCAEGEGRDYDSWSVGDTRRGGARGKAPLLFIVSGGEDLIIGRVRTVDDRVAVYLGKGDLRQAVEAAGR